MDSPLLLLRDIWIEETVLAERRESQYPTAAAEVFTTGRNFTWHADGQQDDPLDQMVTFWSTSIPSHLLCTYHEASHQQHTTPVTLKRNIPCASLMFKPRAHTCYPSTSIFVSKKLVIASMISAFLVRPFATPLPEHQLFNSGTLNLVRVS